MPYPLNEVTIAVGLAVGLAAAAMLFHLFGRLLFKSRDLLQASLDEYLVAQLPNGVSEELMHRLRKAPAPVARRGLVHALHALGEEYLEYIHGVYQQLGFVDAAFAALRSSRWAKRAEGALELAALQHVEAAPECLRLLTDRRAEVRQAAARALSDLRSPGAVRAILETTPVCTRWAISTTVELILLYGESAAPELLAALAQSPSRTARLAAVEALGQIGCREAFPFLEKLVDDPDMEARIFATRALGRIGEPAAIPVLSRTLQNNAWEVRAVAARAIGAYRSPEVLPLLQSALADPSWWVRTNAGESLAAFEQEGAEALRRTLASQDAFARQMATQMLEKLFPKGEPS